MRKIGLVIAVFAAALGTAKYLVSRTEGPRQLALVSHVRLSAIYSVKVRPPYAYALEAGLLHVLDISKPKEVRKLSELSFRLARSRIAIHRDWLFLSGFANPLGLVDISQPDKLRWAGEFPELGGILSGGLDISGDMLYAVSMADRTSLAWPMRHFLSGAPVSLQIVDIRNPRRPARLATVDLDIVLHMAEGVNVAAAGNRVYLLVRNARTDIHRSELIRVNVTDRSHPFIERRDLLPQGKNFKAIRVLGDMIYLLEMVPQHGLALFLLHEDAAPTPIGEIMDPSLWWGIELVISQNYVYATFKGAEANVVTFDVSNPAQPRIVDRYSIKGFGAAGLGMDLVGGRLYVAGDWAPMPIFDVSTGVPRLLGQWNYHGGWADELDVNGSDLYIASWGGGLVAYDVDEPLTPKLRWISDRIKNTELEQDLTLPKIWGEYVLLGFDSRPSELLDISGHKPKLIASYQPIGTMSALAVSGDFAYFGTSNASAESKLEAKPQEGAIEVVQHKGTGLHLMTRLKVSAGIADLVAQASRVVALTTTGDILIFGTKEPALLRQIGQLRLGEAGNTSQLAVAGDHAFVLAQTWAGTDLYIITLASPELRIVHQRHFEDGGAFAALAVIDKYLILYAGQLKVFDVSRPATPVLITEQQLESLDEPSALAICAGYLYVSDSENGVWIYALPL